jgi:hypothetical protein
VVERVEMVEAIMPYGLGCSKFSVEWLRKIIHMLSDSYQIVNTNMLTKL